MQMTDFCIASSKPISLLQHGDVFGLVFLFFSREDGSSTHHVAQVNLELTTLPLPSKSDSYKHI